MRPLKWVPLSALAVLILVSAFSGYLRNHEIIYRENGVLESLSVTLWCIGALLGFWATFRKATAENRLLAFLMASIALLAALREVDAHIWLNPQHFGSLGVRYRVDWWLNPEVSLPVKLGWGIVFLTILTSLAYPLIRLRRSLYHSVRAGAPVPLLILAAVLFLGVGFAFDDLLRHASWVASNTRQLMEETAEVLGAFLYLTAVIVHLREEGAAPR
jgi:hypothetical protein